MTFAFRAGRLTTGEAGRDGVAVVCVGVCVGVAALLEDTTPMPDELVCGTTDTVFGDDAVLAAC